MTSPKENHEPKT